MKKFNKILHNIALGKHSLTFIEKEDYFTTMILSVPIFLKDDNILFKLQANDITIILNTSFSIKVNDHTWKFIYEKI
jgi:hypothetical protein